MENIRIMIVEDEMIVAWSLRMQLESWGYQVTSIQPGGASAITAYGTEKPDLVLLDILLGDAVDGISVAEAIKDSGGAAHIFLTASRDPETYQRAVQTRPIEILSKPYSDLQLKNVLEQAALAQRKQPI
mgnify:CR=1 FL=1